MTRYHRCQTHRVRKQCHRIARHTTHNLSVCTKSTLIRTNLSKHFLKLLCCSPFLISSTGCKYANVTKLNSSTSTRSSQFCLLMWGLPFSARAALTRSQDWKSNEICKRERIDKVVRKAGHLRGVKTHWNQTGDRMQNDSFPLMPFIQFTFEWVPMSSHSAFTCSQPRINATMKTRPTYLAPLWCLAIPITTEPVLPLFRVCHSLPL